MAHAADRRLPPVRSEPAADMGKCGRCHGSLCCQYITQKIETPRSRYDFDHLFWQISHAGIKVFKDEGGWFLLIESRCRHLADDGRCSIHAVRPQICRAHSNEFCEYDSPLEDGWELYFDDPAKLDTYCRKRFKGWDKRFEAFARDY